MTRYPKTAFECSPFFFSVFSFVLVLMLSSCKAASLNDTSTNESTAAEDVQTSELQSEKEKAAELDGTHGASVDLIRRPIEVRKLADNVHVAIGVGNVFMITTSEGNVIFDTGFAPQATQQMRALKSQASNADVSHIIISHSHADHIGGAKIWSSVHPDAKLVAHRELEEEQRYLTELEQFQFRRNRWFFPWLPSEIPERPEMFRYGGVKPSVLVDEASNYKFRLGGVDFEVISAPGAEGSDNIVLWLPQQKILFSGDFFGPQFPQFPNIVSLRGEKMRKPIEYIRSLDKVIALKPVRILPSHFNPTEGEENILKGLHKTRDAVQYVHDETVKAMNENKTLWQAMDTIALPDELSLPENHGRVSWAVRSIWEYYGTWFHGYSTTQLYTQPVSTIYSDLVAIAGESSLINRAREYMEAKEPLKVLHLAEIVLAENSSSRPALELTKAALFSLKEAAVAGLKNDYEIYWLDAQLAIINQRLDK